VETHYWLGLCYRRLQRPQEAREAFTAAVQRAPESEFGRKAAAELETLLP
jgi:TolA-binding protein